MIDCRFDVYEPYDLDGLNKILSNNKKAKYIRITNNELAEKFDLDLLDSSFDGDSGTVFMS
jgi:hypothetical protein